MKQDFCVIGVFISFWMLIPAAFAQQPAVGQKAGNESAFKLLVKDVEKDYKHTFSKETAIWYEAGLTASGLVHVADDDIREELGDTQASIANVMKGGSIYGAFYVQLPLAVGWWGVSHALQNTQGADAGRDLLRAQINSMTWTFAIKFAAQRKRPNGRMRSFPSGHASATFAAAMVLQEHYGWKVGMPFFLAAGYTAVSRIHDNKHWASDVVFGTAIGMASARTVTLHMRKYKIVPVPSAVPDGAAISFILLR